MKKSSGATYVATEGTTLLFVYTRAGRSLIARDERSRLNSPCFESQHSRIIVIRRIE
jgi:hypothetical protein